MFDPMELELLTEGDTAGEDARTLETMWCNGDDYHELIGLGAVCLHMGRQEANGSETEYYAVCTFLI